MSEPRIVGEGLDKVLSTIEGIRSRSAETKTSAPKAQRDPPPKTEPEAAPQTARVPPSKRGQIEAMNAIIGLRGGVIEKKPISYYTPILIQCTLPHSDPKTPAWARKNGDFSLVISSGFDKDANAYGIPYGAFPRLVMAYIITHVIGKPNDCRIKLADHFGEFLREVGYTGNYKGNSIAGKRVRDQMMRLFNATIAFRYDETTAEFQHDAARSMLIAPSFDLWWNFKQPEQGVLFDSWIEISEDFRKTIVSRHVPLRTDILKELRKSPLAIDVYMWLSSRLFSMKAAQEREVYIPYGALQNQFGTGIAEENYRQFRSELKRAFVKVAALWHHGSGPQPDKSFLKYEFTEGGLFLYTTPLLIGRGDRLTTQEQADNILEERQFSREVIIRARQFSGKWDIDRLQSDYFQWLAATNTTPKNPEAHFIQFVKSHVKRNP